MVDRVENMANLCNKLTEDTLTLSTKCSLLKDTEDCVLFLKKNPHFESFFYELPHELLVIALSILAIGQGENIFREKILLKDNKQKIISLLEQLIPVEEFYEPIGGIVGYQGIILSLLHEKPNDLTDQSTYLRPKGVDITTKTDMVHTFIREAIEKSHLVAEIYPVGGAGDRLCLMNESNEPLPAAILSFCGHTLLERLIRDVEAREYLIHKLTGKRIETKIGMMTSHEKRNDEYIRDNLKRRKWFGRNPDSFHLFVQPQVPVLDQEGNWLLKEPYKLVFKPGGHGAIWGEAVQYGLFSLFKETGIKKVLLRQINNPIGGTDHGLLAFLGYGLKNDKAFGFASCERAVNANEGMDVVIETKGDNHWDYVLTNIEYTEFKRKGIKDVPKNEGDHYSIFPANTNILFADIEEIERGLETCRIPGMTLNLKTKFNAIDQAGHLKEVVGGRLESTMQNIADEMSLTFPYRLSEEQQYKLKSYLTYNERIKTISVTKKSWKMGEDFLETPEGCFLDMMKNAEDLLENYCHFKLPKAFQEEPSFVFLYHPALGPLYDVIQQKLRYGELGKGSELIVEIPEVDIERLQLKGSLIITHDCDHPACGYQEAKCRLNNVQVINKGLGSPIDVNYWKNPNRIESLHIKLEEGAMFEAENVEFKGPLEIKVPKNVKAVARNVNGKCEIHYESIHSQWSWKYIFDEHDRICLLKELA